jgi:hypothetical protein
MKITQKLTYFSRQEPLSIHFEPDNKYQNRVYNYEFNKKIGVLNIDLEYDYNNIHWTDFYEVELNDSKDLEEIFSIMKMDNEEIEETITTMLNKKINKKKFYLNDQVNYKYIWCLMMNRPWKP